jgi:flagellar hook-length control protein FliK
MQIASKPAPAPTVASATDASVQGARSAWAVGFASGAAPADASGSGQSGAAGSSRTATKVKTPAAGASESTPSTGLDFAQTLAASLSAQAASPQPTQATVSPVPAKGAGSSAPFALSGPAFTVLPPASVNGAQPGVSQSALAALAGDAQTAAGDAEAVSGQTSGVQDAQLAAGAATPTAASATSLADTSQGPPTNVNAEGQTQAAPSFAATPLASGADQGTALPPPTLSQAPAKTQPASTAPTASAPAKDQAKAASSANGTPGSIAPNGPAFTGLPPVSANDTQPVVSQSALAALAGDTQTVSQAPSQQSPPQSAGTSGSSAPPASPGPAFTAPPPASANDAQPAASHSALAALAGAAQTAAGDAEAVSGQKSGVQGAQTPASASTPTAPSATLRADASQIAPPSVNAEGQTQAAQSFAATPLASDADQGAALSSPTQTLSQAPAKSLAASAAPAVGAPAKGQAKAASSAAAAATSALIAQDPSTSVIAALTGPLADNADEKDDGSELDPGGQDSQVDQGADASAGAQATLQPDGALAAAQMQTASAAASGPTVQPKVTAQTVSQLSAQIVQTTSGGKSSFEMTLHPEGLGDVRVKVSVDRNGAVTADMSFSNPQAAAELGARAGDLKDALAQAGFTVADNGLNFNLGGQDQSGAGQNGWANGANGGQAFQNTENAAEDLLSSVSQAAIGLQRPAGGLDIRI